MKSIQKTLITIILCTCIFFNHTLLTQATFHEDTYSASKETPANPKFSTKDFNYTLLENAVFPSPETEWAAINSMTPREYTDALYREAIDFFVSTKINLGWKKVLCIGDSITLGVQTGYDEPYPNSYPEVLGYKLHTYAQNEGMGSSTIWGSGPFAMCKRIVDYGPADAVFIFGGTNDWFYGYQCKLGDLDTPITFIYDLDLLCQHLQELYSNAEVFFVIPIDPGEHAGVEPYDDFEIIRNNIRDRASQYGFHIIDLPAKKILSALDPETRNAYFSDMIHPNTLGYQMLGTIIAYEALKCMYGPQENETVQ